MERFCFLSQYLTSKAVADRNGLISDQMVEPTHDHWQGGTMSVKWQLVELSLVPPYGKKYIDSHGRLLVQDGDEWRDSETGEVWTPWIFMGYLRGLDNSWGINPKDGIANSWMDFRGVYGWEVFLLEDRILFARQEGWNTMDGTPPPVPKWQFGYFG